MERLEISYAAALLNTTADNKEAGVFEDILGDYSHALESSEELCNFILNPVLAKKAKKDALLALAPKDAPKAINSFLCLLVDKGRIEHLPRIYEEFVKMRSQRYGMLQIKVCSSMPLDEKEQERICAYFKKLHGASDARLDLTIDPALIGGLRVQVGDVLYDQSLFGRLNGLKQAISREIARHKN